MILENLESVILNLDVWLQSFHNVEYSTSWNLEYKISLCSLGCYRAKMVSNHYSHIFEFQRLSLLSSETLITTARPDK